MNLFGTNYAEQAEIYMPSLDELYRSEFRRLGVTGEFPEGYIIDPRKKEEQEGRSIISPLLTLIFEQELEQFEWFKTKQIVSRIATLVPESKDDDNIGGYRVGDADYFLPSEVLPNGTLTVNDVMLDAAQMQERTNLLRDIAFMSPITRSRLPAKNTSLSLLDLVKVRVQLTTCHHIKKRALSSHAV